MRVLLITFGILLLLVACGAGAGPYDSERQLVSALERQVKKECKCGEARYEYFSSGKKSNVSGCGKIGKNTSTILARYNATPSHFKTSRTQSLRSELAGCLAMD